MREDNSQDALPEGTLAKPACANGESTRILRCCGRFLRIRRRSEKFRNHRLNIFRDIAFVATVQERFLLEQALQL